MSSKRVSNKVPKAPKAPRVPKAPKKEKVYYTTCKICGSDVNYKWFDVCTACFYSTTKEECQFIDLDLSYNGSNKESKE